MLPRGISPATFFGLITLERRDRRWQSISASEEALIRSERLKRNRDVEFRYKLMKSST
jgi:hypothetical protein